MILLNWLNAFRHRIRQRRRTQQLPGSRTGRASTPGRSKRPSRPSRLTPGQIELLEGRVLLSVITVTSLADNTTVDGQVTFREAIQAAETDAAVDGSTAGSGADTIVFQAGLDGDITLATAISITTDVTIQGPTADEITLKGGTSTSAATGRILQFSSGTSVVSGLTFTEGKGDAGGALTNAASSTLTIRDSVFVANQPAGSSVPSGGAIQNSGTLTIEDTYFDSNVANREAGAIKQDGGTLTISGTTFRNNTTSGSRGGGAIAANAGTTTITNSTFSANRANGAGSGGAIRMLAAATTTVINSTFSANVAGGSGDAIINASGTLTLHNNIFVGHTDDDISGAAAAASSNNIIGNAASTDGLTHGVQGNIRGNSGTGLLTASTVINTTLADNGGPTLTHALAAGSIAINAGNNTEAAGLTNDQRGAPFLRIQNSTVDIGALEELAPLDYGDASLYATTFAEDGARHTPTGLTLGPTRDSETNATGNATATGDDITGSDDEDGVTFGTITVGQQNATVTVNVQGAAGKLDAWIDFNGDGSFFGIGEQIADNLSVMTGNNTVAFDVPADAIDGNVIARFRLSTLGGLAPTGLAADGEVEDYQVSLTAPAGSGTFVQSASLGSLLVQGTAAADFNSDGNQDVIFTHNGSTYSLFLGNGDGTFGAEMNFALAGSSRDIVAADIDGDGDIDFFTGSASGSSQVSPAPTTWNWWTSTVTEIWTCTTVMAAASSTATMGTALLQRRKI
jgi:hypothetical protein